MPAAGSPAPPPTEAEALEWLSAFVALAPTNLEDPAHHRYEKPEYPRAAERLVRAARGFGLRTRVFDPLIDSPHSAHLRSIPRPNVIVDLDRPGAERVLILAHYDVVPVPAEQMDRWRSPPHVLTRRANGRWYGRGANDDLGSGVLASLLALRRLALEGDAPRSVRLLLCCDEETGGEGGVESMKGHDDALPPGDPGRFLLGDVALIPDGSPHATAGSSGVVFLDAVSATPIPLLQVVELGERLAAFHEVARGWKSQMASPDWPDHGAPEPVITGRATVTKFDAEAPVGSSARFHLIAAHAETDAANLIAEAVTLVFGGAPEARASLVDQLTPLVSPPFRIQLARTTSLTIPPAATAIQLIGTSSHGGYPHRGHNPVPAALRLLREAVGAGIVEAGAPLSSSFAVDLRLPPEMGLAEGRDRALSQLRGALSTAGIAATLDAPESRCRGGYALSAGDRWVGRLEALLRQELDEPGIFGEYGGTDASTLSTVRTPAGAPLPALVFGSMDREAHIHEAEESVDPRLLLGISNVIYRFLREP